jgi:hypothetical protein
MVAGGRVLGEDGRGRVVTGPRFISKISTKTHVSTGRALGAGEKKRIAIKARLAIYFSQAATSRRRKNGKD